VGDKAARTIQITTKTSATQDNDYLHMDIKGIVNSYIPKDFGTEGYYVDIKTFTSDGVLLEVISTIPFFISESGTNTVSGDIHGVFNGDTGTTTIFMGSPMTGHMETDIYISGDGGAGADGSYSFTNLPDGEYFIFTEPSITLGSNSYFGSNKPEPLWITGNASKDLTLSPETAGGAAIKVILTGDFSTDGTPDDVDIFAGSPDGFRKKTLTSVGNTAGTASTTIYLSEGEWMLGIGPAMQENTMSAPPMPDWMPPANVYYSSDGSSADTVNFSISGQSVYTVSGYIYNDADGDSAYDSGEGIADSEVWAYQPMGGYGGAYTKTATDGSYILKIPVLGVYNMGAYKPGLPEPKEKVIDVSGNMTGQNIKITKPPYTISGKVVNSSGNAVAYAPVWAWQDGSWGHSDTMTDSAGNYILYVNAGTWYVETDIPSAGWMQYERSLTVTTASFANINLSPDYDTNFYTISGTVGIDTNGTYSTVETAFSNMPIRAVEYNANGVYQGKEFNGITDSNGDYAITVPAGIYRVDIWTKEYGELGVNNQNSNNTLKEIGIDDAYSNNPANINATGGDVTNADIIIVQGDLNNVSVAFENETAGLEAYLNIEGVDFSKGYPEPTGFYMNKRINDLSATTTVKLANGDYFFFVDIPGLGSYIPNASDRDGTKDDIVVSGDRDVGFTLPDATSEVSTISGTVIAGGSPLGNAWVWIGNPNSYYQNGVQTASDGTYSINVPAGTGYKMGADKPGYMSDEPINLDASSDVSGKNFSLTISGYTISGYIYADVDSDSSYDAGEGVPNGFVRAETTKCLDLAESGTCVRAHAPVDGAGYYELGVVNGVWKVYGMADGYQESEFGANITVSSVSQTSKHIKLNVNNSWNAATKKKSITPSSGGSVDDTDPSGSGVKLTIPPNALGSSNSAGNVNTKKTSSVAKTSSSDPVGGTGVSVTATDNSGQAITNLDDYIDVEMVLYKADVDAAITAETLTYNKLKNTKNGYWDPTTNDWVNLSTTRKAYYSTTTPATNWILYANTATTVPAFEAFVNEVVAGTLTAMQDYKLVFTSKSNHLTIFAVIMPFISQAVDSTPAPVVDPPAPPSGGGGGGITYCRSVEYGEWGECIGGIETREVSSKSPSGCRLTSNQEAEKEQVCLVAISEEELEDDISAGDVAGAVESVFESSIDALYLDQGAFIEKGEVNEIMQVMGIGERNHIGEQLSRGTLINTLKIDMPALEPRVQYALTNFITYGSPDTRIGWGERGGVLNSFMSAFGKVPTTTDNWSDIIKIANGRWPNERSEMSENRATEHFRKIYLREPNRANPHDDAAVTVIAYGLRPANRNMESESAAIKIFKAIYQYHPTSAVDWDVVRAIAYSGATR
jgi:hypothetical protein